MTSAPPRFSGPAKARQRMRLAAALGVLAIAALTTGGLASLATKEPVPAAARAEPAPAPPRELPDLIDPVRLVEARVETAERAVQQARAAVGSARQLGLLDPEQLDQLERRLEPSQPAKSLAPATTPSAEVTSPAPGMPEPGSTRLDSRSRRGDPADTQPRSL